MSNIGFNQRHFLFLKKQVFYYKIPDINIDQFTITHSGYYPFHNGDTSKNIIRHEHFKRRLLDDVYNGKISKDTIEKIDDRYYSIIYLNGFDKIKQKYFAEVIALTTIKNNEIMFQYDIKTKDTINLIEFYTNSIKFIRTVRISNGI